MLQLLFLFCSFQIFSTVKSGSHSLWTLSTRIIGDTPFPEFSVVVMLDDIQVAYYDSNVKKLIYRQYKSEHEDEEQENASLIFGDLHSKMNFYLLQLNRTHGVHTRQELVVCELLDNDNPGLLRVLDALNGVNISVLQFNVQQNTLQIEDGTWPQEWTPTTHKKCEWLYANEYSPICFKFLKNCLHVKKNDLMKKVKPRVRLLQRTLPSGGVKVTCLATGFYPRHINLTLLRDGQPVSDHQITGGELLPNLDGTYQMRKSLEVSTEELRVKHHYSCTVEHLSLDNKLDVKPDLDPGVGTVSIVIPVVVLGVALLCVVGAVVFMRRRRQSSTPSDYDLTQSSEDSNLEVNQNQNLEL
ncbi:major histocompatibility complex class I-related gene protein-like [Clupea harengus]|uniref:Major histocompatibility complex class I-related gene protein-like n=1 Tax=Clupea harengus TaxID=7950 RepID=A0A8M1KNF0_CLUHA|nr:major histocompatibility complex class I-related gene protein-like [Clupea harengus]